jgi:hypothetical protein
VSKLYVPCTFEVLISAIPYLQLTTSVVSLSRLGGKTLTPSLPLGCGSGGWGKGENPKGSRVTRVRVARGLYRAAARV